MATEMTTTKESKELKHIRALHPRAEEMQKQWGEIDDVVFDKVRHKLEKYLPKTDEEDDSYELRKSLARFKAETPGLLSKAVGAVFTTPPTRPKKITKEWGSLIDNADGTGVDLNTYLEDSLFEALAFGASVILVDKPATTIEGEGEDRRDTGQVIEKTSKGFATVDEVHDREKGELLLVRYKLSQCTNWSVDRKGELNWLRIKEIVTRQETPADKSEDVELYWEWDRTSWRRWKVVEKDSEEMVRGGKILDIEVEAQGRHNLGIVPVATIAIHRNGTAFSFESAIRFAYHWDIEMFQDWVDLRYDCFMHAHPTKYRKCDRSKAELTPIGPNSEIIMDKDEDHGYLEYPSSATEQLRQNVEAGLQGVKRAAGIDPLGSSDSAGAMGASGRARAIAFTIGERRFLQRYSRAVKSAEMRIFEIAERWESDKENLTVHDKLVTEGPTYSQRFDTTGADEIISAWQDTRGEINSDDYDRDMQKKIVDANLPDLPSEKREVIVKQIDDNPLIGKADPIVDDDPSMIGSANDAIAELEDLSAAEFEEKEVDDDATDDLNESGGKK